MRLTWIDDILAVAETGSLSLAAERRGLTQPAFSRRLQAIEQHLGVELFDRSRKPMRLRPPTLERREEMAALAARLRQLVEDLRREQRSSANRIVISSQHALTTFFAPSLIRRLEHDSADIFVRLRSANLDGCHAQLFGRRADIALVYRSDGLRSEFESGVERYLDALVVGSDRLVPVGTPDILREPLPLVSYPSEVYLGRLLDTVVLPGLRATVAVQPKVETALTLAALALAEHGLGVAWVPRSLAAGRVAGARLRDLSEHLPAADLDIVALRLKGEIAPAEARVWSILADRTTGS